MKKVILMMMAVLISAITFSQTFYKVTQCSYSLYINNEWVTQETNYPKKMFVILNKENIKITNESESNFVVYGKVETNEYSTHTALTWDAYDKNAVQCKIIIKINKDDDDNKYSLSILYDTRCLDYALSEK